MIKKADFVNRCWQLPNAYEDLCNGLYDSSVKSGCCEDVYNFMLDNPSCTSDEVFYFYFECIGGIPEPIEIVDDEVLDWNEDKVVLNR